MSLRSILGGSSRVKKSTKPSGAKRSSSSPSIGPPSASWTSSLARTKPATKRSNSSNGKLTTTDPHNDEFDLLDDKLDDYGLVRALATDQNLRDISQAIHHIRAHMFSSLPEQCGMGSVKIAEVLNYQKNMPKIVTVSHIQALLTSSPSAVEREIAELVRSGFLRRIVVAMRGDIGDTLILSLELAQLVQSSPSLSAETKTRFLAHLQENPGKQVVEPGTGSSGLLPNDISYLVKAGFLTSHGTGGTNFSSMSDKMNVYSRPEDRGTLTSLETISRQAAGSLGAVGGEGALYEAGGSGGGSLSQHHQYQHQDHPSGGNGTSGLELKLAVPGNGTFLKLVSAALEYLVSLLTKSNPKYRELPEFVLRDRWDGSVASSRDSEARYAAKKARREFAGLLPGQTRKWRQFQGLSFDWILQEAVGSGLVEVFETRSVGRGVRACAGRSF